MQPPDPEDVGSLLETVFDGLVFRPVEWIKGGSEQEVVVRVATTYRNAESGEVFLRLQSDSYPFTTADVGRKFLLLLSRRYAQEPDLWHYTHGLSGASRIDGEGKLVAPASLPITTCCSNTTAGTSTT